MKIHRNVPLDSTKKLQEAEFLIFALKPGNRHLAALMASDLHQINMVGRYGQGQHTLVTLSS